MKHHLHFSLNKKYIHLLLLIILSVLIITRLTKWFIDYQILNLNNQFSYNDKKRASNYSLPAIVLCNLNPFKGSEIFKSVNGSGLYDSVIDRLISTNPISDEFLMSYENFSNTFASKFNHGIRQMLISCKVDNEECNQNSFVPKKHGLLQCYQMSITSQNRIISLVLNSEQYDYLVPVSKYVGFKIWINNGLKVKEETVIATPGNHNIIDIKVSENALFSKNFSDEKHPITENNLYPMNMNIPAYFSIVKLNQVMTLPIYNRIVYNTIRKTFYSNLQTSISNSYLIQCRSIIRYFDKESFANFQKATEIGLVIDRKKRLLLFNYAILNSFLIDNINSFDKLNENSEKCTFMIKIQQIRDSLNFFSDNNYYYSFSNNNETLFNNRELKQLSILRMVYNKRFDSSLSVNIYQKHINLLSDIIVKVNMHFKYRCDSNFIENVSSTFLNYLKMIRTLLLDYKNAILSFQNYIGLLRKSLNRNNELVFEENTEALNVLKNSLVSITFKISNHQLLLIKESMHSIFLLHYFSNIIELLIIIILIGLLVTLTFNLVNKYNKKRFPFKFSNSIVQYQCQTMKRISEINSNETTVFSPSNIVSNHRPITFLL